MTDPEDHGLSLPEALEQVQQLRQRLGAQTVMVIFDLPRGGEMTMVADEEGTDLFADGERVPRRDDAE